MYRSVWHCIVQTVLKCHFKKLLSLTHSITPAICARIHAASTELVADNPTLQTATSAVGTQWPIKFQEAWSAGQALQQASMFTRACTGNMVTPVGLERYWHWGIGWVLPNIFQYRVVLGNTVLLLAVIPNTNTVWTP